MADYATKNFKTLLGLPGFSDALLNNHFTLYDGYVKNANKLAGELRDLLKEGKTGTPAYAERKRRFGWEFGGMRLHEYYFENLTKSPKPLASGAPRLAQALAADFGSVEAWEADLKAMGAMRGIGWVILYRDARAERLFNEWVNEHDAGHLPGCAPLLVMDVFEHAFMVDYGLKRADYVAAFMKAVDWDTVSARFEASLQKAGVP
ncbi:MAG: superoxide dismutase [Elusimicrobia bacterium]|nr:superoxide dismutase [Elusimicrobiota bacterium]